MATTPCMREMHRGESSRSRIAPCKFAPSKRHCCPAAAAADGVAGHNLPHS